MKKKEIEPSVYAVAIFNPAMQRFDMTILVAFTSEEAREIAQKNYLKRHQGEALGQLDFTMVSIPGRQVAMEMTALEVREEVKEDGNSKNRLMKRIIDNKDLILYKQNEKKFTAVEKKFILSQIK